MAETEAERKAREERARQEQEADADRRRKVHRDKKTEAVKKANKEEK